MLENTHTQSHTYANTLSLGDTKQTESYIEPNKKLITNEPSQLAYFVSAHILNKMQKCVLTMK